jgi:hypothetical protein
MLTIITPELIKKYSGGHLHSEYKQTVEIMTDMRAHSDGDKVGLAKLIDERRPQEDEEYKKYRIKILVEITKPIIGKVITSLSKIRKSQDWSCKFDPKNVPSSITPDEVPQKYFDEKYPFFKSLDAWLFSVCLKNYLVDPNGLVVIAPLNVAIPESELYKPFAIVFNSDQVMDYVHGDYAVLKSRETNSYKEDNVEYNDGLIMYIFTTTKIQKWVQIKRDKTMLLSFDFDHNIGELPVFKLGGILKESKGNIHIYESRISAMLPHLKEAVREYSDLQAEVVQHVNSKTWQYAAQDCTRCKGTGMIKKGEKSVKCTECGGHCKIVTSPFQNNMLVTPPGPGMTQVPIPPAGYITKDTSIVKIQDERIEKHKYNALSAINMEFLAETPLNESGVSKLVDREEHHSFVYSVAEDLVGIKEKVLYFSTEMRYMVLVPAKETRALLLPAQSVPEKFDLINSNYLVEELKKAKDAGVSSIIIRSLEMEYASKKFNTDMDLKKFMDLSFNLDPMPGMTEDEKQSKLSNKGISQEDYVISSNINPFVKQALYKNPKYDTLKFEDQIKVLREMAKEKIKEISSASEIAAMIEPDPNVGVDPAQKGAK